MRNLFRLVLLSALLTSISSCAPRETIELVVIGDAFGANTIPQAYEAAVRDDLDADVNLYRWIKPTQAQHEWLNGLRTNTELRSAVKNADVILLAISPKWGNSAENRYLLNLCGGDDNQDCLRETTAKARRDWTAIVNLLAEIREGQPVILRVILWGDWIYPANYEDAVTPEQIAVMIPYFHEFQSLQSATPGAQTVVAFPEDYDKLPKEYFEADGLHLSEAGSVAAVDLLRALGYEPAVLEAMVDLTVTFNETGCTVTSLEGDVPNPIYIRVENPTAADNALVVFTVNGEQGAQDILDYKGDGLPPFADMLGVSHLAPGPNSNESYEVTLTEGRENFFVCAQDGAGALAVPTTLTP